MSEQKRKKRMRWSIVRVVVGWLLGLGVLVKSVFDMNSLAIPGATGQEVQAMAIGAMIAAWIVGMLSALTILVVFQWRAERKARERE